MGTAIIIIFLVIIGVFGIKSYMKKLNSGCCGAGGDKENKIEVSDTDETHYPYSAKIKITGMHCENCKTRVENALNRTDGVWARVDLKSGTADVKMKKRLPEIELRRIISAIGYGIEKVDFAD
mgnify:FL=1